VQVFWFDDKDIAEIPMRSSPSGRQMYIV